MVAKGGEVIKLYYNEQGEGAPVILLHGLFGAGNNLGALGRSLRDRYRVFALDLPNHGRSDWVDQTDLSALADVVWEWMQQRELSVVRLVGHSLGGKVAMQLALSKPDSVAALVVADIAPVAYPPHHDQVFAALDAVEAAACRSREEAAQLMAAYLDEDMVVQFLLMSLSRQGAGEFSWRFNLQGLKRGYAAIREAPLALHTYPGPVQFIKGGDSDYLLPQHRETILALFPQAKVKVMPGCGHWLHAQQPRLFNSMVGRFIDDSGGSS